MFKFKKWLKNLNLKKILMSILACLFSGSLIAGTTYNAIENKNNNILIHNKNKLAWNEISQSEKDQMDSHFTPDVKKVIEFAKKVVPNFKSTEIIHACVNGSSKIGNRNLFIQYLATDRNTYILIIYNPKDLK